MFRMIGVAVLFGALSIHAQSNVRMSYDFAGKGKAALYGQGDYYDVASGYSFGAEYLTPVHPNITLGAGLGFQTLRRMDGPDSTGLGVASRGKIGFVPLYFIAMAHIPSQVLMPFIKASLGYNWLMADKKFKGNDASAVKGDITVGAGLGVIYKKKIIFEGMFNFHAGAIEGSNSGLGLVEYNIDYVKVSATIGYVIGEY